MPVMEGKSVLYKKFGDIDSIPICIDTKDPEEFVNIVTNSSLLLAASTWKTLLHQNATGLKMNSSNAAPSRFSMMTSTEPPSLPALPSLALALCQKGHYKGQGCGERLRRAGSALANCSIAWA